MEVAPLFSYKDNVEKEGGSPETISSRGGIVSSKRKLASRPVQRYEASLASSKHFWLKIILEKKKKIGGEKKKRRNKILFSSW